MSEFIVRDAIIPELTGESKENVIREMVQSLCSSGYLRGTDQETIIKAVLDRERLASTGIGRGVAIPHAKHSSVDRPIGTVAISRRGVPFDSLDGDPVQVFVLLISPQDRPGDHLRALENASSSLKNDSFVESLRQSDSRETIVDLIENPKEAGTS